MRQFLLNIAKRVLPDPFVDWYRRRRAMRRYLRDIGYELYDRQVRLDLEDLEGRIAARRHGFTEQLTKDILERTDLILQELDRRIQGVEARHGNELRRLREEVEALQDELGHLRNDAGAVEGVEGASANGAAATGRPATEATGAPATHG